MASNVLHIPKTMAKNLMGPCITVNTGSEATVCFYVHEDLACESSEFLRNAIKGQWKESSDRSVDLLHEEPEIFAIYMNWLYFRSIPTRIDEPAPQGNQEYLQLAKAYGLADRLQDLTFQNAVIDAFIDKTTTKTSDGQCWSPVGPVIRCIYENTPRSSKARNLLVDLYTYNAHRDWLTKWADEIDFPQEFLYDLTLQLLDMAADKTNRKKPIANCRYHQRCDSQTCTKKM